MQKNKLFMGGLAWATNETSLRTACERFGQIEEVRVITDQATGRSKGFGFVTFSSDEAAAKCKAEMDGQIIDGRTIKVDFPREREEHGGSRGGGGGFGGGSGGGGYDRGGGAGGRRGY